MGTFNTNLKLGQQAFGVTGGLDPEIVPLTVGQLRITQTHPAYKPRWDDAPCYHEECMCVETGIGSGTIWQFNKNIFATEADAKVGVIIHRQRAHAARAAREAQERERDAQQRERDLATLRRLQAQYGKDSAT